MRILSLSCTYPNGEQPDLGTFVQSRLLRLASLVELKVIAPVALIDYGKRLQRVKPASQRAAEKTSQIEVLHPRWFYPPLFADCNGILLFLQLLLPVWKLRKQFQFEWIDSHFAFPDGIAAALLSAVFRVPFSITLRGCETVHESYPIRGFMMRWAMKRATRVVAVSEQLRRFALECGCLPAATATIGNGVDTGVFHAGIPSIQNNYFRISAGESLILCVGNLVEEKGQSKIIEALAKLRARGVLVRAAFVGGAGDGGQYLAHLRSLAHSLGVEASLCFPGRIDQARIAALLNDSAVLCLASSREGCPNVVLEALACGTPVVATAVGGVPEMIPSAEYGLLVPGGDPTALADALSAALSIDWDHAAISQFGAARSWETVAAEVLKFFREGNQLASVQ